MESIQFSFNHVALRTAVLSAIGLIILGSIFKSQCWVIQFQ